VESEDAAGLLVVRKISHTWFGSLNGLQSVIESGKMRAWVIWRVLTLA